MTAACMLLIAIFSAIGTLHAAPIEKLSVVVTNEQVSAPADHTVTFVTPSGVDASSDTIVFTYGASADLSAISAPGDLDLAIDNDAACDGPFTDRVLASSASVGVWGVAKSGNNITFSPPTDAVLGEIPAGFCVQVQLGLNATFGSAGVSQIVNPSSIGSYLLSIAGGFGDSKAAAIPVVDSNEVAITASVGGGGGGGGPPGGGGCGDTTAPTMYNVEVSNVTETTASVSWGTDENATGSVRWGTTTSFSDGEITNTQSLSSHAFTIEGLTPGTHYFVLLSSSDFCGNDAFYGPLDFTAADETAPAIIDPQVTDQSSTSCTVQWLTDEPATSSVDYGTTTTHEIGTVSDNALVTDHAIVLNNLNEGVTYYIRIRSTDAAGNEAVYTGLNCTTLANVPPSNALSASITSECGANHLEWTLPSDPDLAGARIVFRTDQYPTDPFDGALIYNKLGTSFSHTGLSDGVKYYYGIFTYDSAGNFASGLLVSGTPTCPTVTGPVSPIGPIPPAPTPGGVEGGGLLTAPALAIGPGECDVCSHLSYDLYIVNPDGTERHTGTDWVLVTDLGDGVFRVAFEDRSLNPDDWNFDYNDSVIDVDLRDCSAIKFTFVSVSADWKHKVRFTTFVDEREVRDTLLGDDSTAVIGTTKTVNAADYATDICPGFPIPSVPVPTPVPTEIPIVGAPLSADAITFYGAGGTIALTANEEGRYQILAGTPFLVAVETSAIQSRLESIQYSLNGSLYNLSSSYEGMMKNGALVGPVTGYLFGTIATVDAPKAGTYLSELTVRYTDNTFQVFRFVLEVPSQGFVFTKTAAGSEPVSGARIELFVLTDGTWSAFNAVPYVQSNPVVTGSDGQFAWYVPNGTYDVRVSKEEFPETRTGAVVVTKNIVAPSIELTTKPQLPSLITGPGGLQEKLVAFVKSPVALVGLGVVAAAAISFFNLFSILRYLLFFLGFLPAAWRKPGGIVYNAIGKSAVRCAELRLYIVEAKITRFLRNTVSNEYGQFEFPVHVPGIYVIVVRKPGYTFPSKKMIRREDDGPLHHLYHGELIEVRPGQTVIRETIPVDPNSSAR